MGIRYLLMSIGLLMGCYVGAGNAHAQTGSAVSGLGVGLSPSAMPTLGLPGPTSGVAAGSARLGTSLADNAAAGIRPRTFVVIRLMRASPELVGYALGADDVIWDIGQGGDSGGSYGGGGRGGGRSGYDSGRGSSVGRGGGGSGYDSGRGSSSDRRGSSARYDRGAGAAR